MWQTQIDAANLRALIRTLRMGKNADFLAGVLFESGTVEPAAILAAANHPAGGLERDLRPHPVRTGGGGRGRRR